MTWSKFTKSEQTARIREWIATGECIDITLAVDDESRAGIPLAVSETFIAILSVSEWHADGLDIIPLDKIADIQIQPDRRKILAWNGVETTNRYFWLDLESYAGLFQSLKKKEQFITVEDEGGLDVGLITAIDPNFVRLTTIDPAGEWEEDTVDYAYQDITIVCVDSEYARVLGAYNRQAAANA